MRTPNKLLLALLVLGLAGVARAPRVAAQGGGPQPGSCELGTTFKDLDVNRVQARAFDTGSLFFGGTSQAIYLVPKASGLSAIFASGIWVGGKVGDELRVAGATYSNYEFWPGPLDPSTARPVNPGDCSAYDHIYKVSTSDIRAVEGGGDLNSYQDLRDWPANLGAPVIAALNNGVDDDNDGLTDEGTDGLDNDDDGLVDERDEQERRIDGGYNFAAGDRPELIGDQALWWVMNDVGNQHTSYATNPIGVEVRVHMFSFDRDNALGDITFYKYTVVYYGDEPLTDTYLSVFADTDLGDAVDDYVGSDTTLSLGFVYNADNDDGTSAGYGVAPPAVGYDFFQGPVVDGDTLGLTRFSYFINGGPAGTSDPATAEEVYNIMQGKWTTGAPMVECGIGIACVGDRTVYAFPDDPTAPDPNDPNGSWSEIAANTAPGDRRFVVTTGPFTLNPGDEQDIVFGIVYGRGNSNLSSIKALRAADIVAQSAYDADFEVPEPPPSPPPCNANDPNLQPGSGNCLEATELDGEVSVVWGYPVPPPNTPDDKTNYLGRFSKLGYDFEGFNVYQYPSADFNPQDRKLVATYDVVNGIFQVNNLAFDLDVGDIVQVPAAFGSDSGIQYYYNPTTDAFTGEPLVNQRDYYYGVSAYAVNLDAPFERVVESAPTQVTVRPSSIAANAGGSVTQSEVGQVVPIQRVEGPGLVPAAVSVVDPARITNANYTVNVESVAVGDTVLTTYVVRRGNEVIFDGVRQLDEGLYVPAIPLTDLGAINQVRETAGVEVFSGQIVLDGLQFLSASSPCEGGCPITDWIYWMMPDRPNGYELFEEAAIGFGGAGAQYDPANDGDTLPSPDPLNGGDCPTDGVYVNYCYHNQAFANNGGGGSSFIYPIGRMVFADFAGDGTTPPTGTVVRLITTPPPYPGVPEDQDGEPDFSGDGRGIIEVEYPGISDLCGPDVPGEDPGCPDYPGNTVWHHPDAAVDYYLSAGSTGGLIDYKRYVEALPPDQFEIRFTDEGGYGVYGFAAAETYMITHVPFEIWNIGDPDDPSDDVRMIPFINPNGSEGTDWTDRFTGNDPFDLSPMFLAGGDVFRFNTADLALVTGDTDTAQAALETIGIVPNPYLGFSAYETGSLDRRVRFTNLPPQVTIQIYTVSGTLIRELTKDGPARSLDWDLTTFSGLPVASGMYLIHIDAKDEDGTDIGERILKFGVVNRAIDVDVF